jgi:ATP-binding cassette subfamily B protein
MENGRTIEEGTHDSLIEQAGHYAELYNTYVRHQSLEYINEAKWRVTMEPEELAGD